MVKELQSKNPEIAVFSVFDEEFSTYGRTLRHINTDEIIKVAEGFEMPSGIVYTPSVEAFEALPVAQQIQDECFGTLPTQIGYCYGQSHWMNATEWHTCSEVNIAVTDMILILGHIWDIKENTIDSSLFKAFYMPKGTVAEVFSTTLHFCPCQVEDAGFRSVVCLPVGTNTALEKPLADKRVTAKNKWLLAHVENEAKIKQGAVAGITGTNFEIKY